MQRGFDEPGFWGERNNPQCESNISTLISQWRAAEAPLVFVRHDSKVSGSPLSPDTHGNSFKDVVAGDPDLLVSKSVNSAFLGHPDLHSWLREHAIHSVVICGITTNHCCETTARFAGNLGYHTYFALDATHTFDRTALDGTLITADELSKITAANLQDEFAQVMSTNDILSAMEP